MNSFEDQKNDCVDPAGKALSEPPVYMPGTQFSIRMILGVSVLFYFYLMPLEPFFLSFNIILIITSLYILFHILWYLYSRKRTVSWAGIRFAAMLDAASAFIVVLIDPYYIPPSGLLIISSVIGNGMQHGLRLFLEHFAVIILLGLPVLTVRQLVFFEKDFFCLPVFFTIIFAGICLYYSYVLLKRIEFLRESDQSRARQDPLTGLYNRTGFLERASYLFSLYQRQKIPMVLMFADLNDFKLVNDTSGHSFGDKVLCHLAGIIGDQLRKTDIAARYGGDEFVFFLVDTDIENAKKVAGRIQNIFAEWTDLNRIKTGISFGMTDVKNGESLESLLSQADNALYEAKKNKNGTGSVVVR
ncbi:MAG: GGDEF domain-containing protein [Thermodesulfobacteriota bacterium]